MVGETLTADTTGIADADGMDNATFTYQWIRSDGVTDTNIPGATSRTYVLADADEGKAISVRVSFTDDADNNESLTSAATGTVAPRPPLTVSLEDPATGHNGTDAFTFKIRFSEQFGISYRTLRDHAFTVTGGEVTRAQRLTQGSNIGWRITVQPDGNGDVTVALPVTTDCDADGAICTADGRMLSAVLSLTVPGPVSQQQQQNSEATGSPTISGTAQVGQTLTADTTGIADADGLDNATFSYEWIRSDGGTDTNIPGATARTYELSDADEGKAIKVRVTFDDDADNEESLTSEATGTVAPRPNREPTGLPAIRGTAQVGQTLTADTSGIADADGLTNATFTYQWIRSDGNTDAEISGETALTYVLSDDDEGNTIKVRVTFNDDADNDESLTSAATAAVAPRPPLTVGLENAASGHNGTDAFTFEIRFSEQFGISYRTLRDHAFTVTGGEVTRAQRLTKGSNIGWRITVQPDGNGDVTVALPVTTDCDADGAICTADGRMLSAVLSLTVPGPVSQQQQQNSEATGSPTISGTAQVGQTLTADTTGIADADGLDNATFSYEWIRSDGGTDTNIPGATARTYELSDADEGKAIKVRVTFDDDADNEESLTSEATGTVAPRPNREPTGLPAISGTAQVGQTLTADTSGIADADGLTNATFTYQWIRSDGNTDAEISGETALTYVLSDDDEGNTIKVRVTFNDDADNDESLTSAATAAVAPRPPLTVGLENAASGHNGTDAFTFEIRFSEQFGISYRTLRDHAFTVTGGEVTRAQRLTKGSNIGWRITVQPDGNGDVTVALPVTTDCDADGAICTADGRMLSNGLEFTLSKSSG